MNRKLAVCAFFSVLLIGSASIHAQDDGQLREEHDYLEMVMNILGFHMEALELITRAESKYSANLVRHAVAIRQTSGLLEHSYPEEARKGDQEWPWKDEKDFERKAHANLQATKQLEKAASKWLKDRDRKEFLVSLEEVKQTCRDCHGDLRDWP